MKDVTLFSKGTPTPNDVFLFQNNDQPEQKTFIEKGKLFTITGTVKRIRSKLFSPRNCIEVIRDKESKEHINEFFLLYFSRYMDCKVEPNMTVKVNCQENSLKHEGRDSLWVAIYADILAIYCPHATIDVEPPFTNKWRDSKDFTSVIVSEEYPGKDTHLSWIPIVNYRRVKIHNTQILFPEYKQGSQDWRKASNEELQRFGEKKLKGTEHTFT